MLPVATFLHPVQSARVGKALAWVALVMLFSNSMTSQRPAIWPVMLILELWLVHGTCACPVCLFWISWSYYFEWAWLLDLSMASTSSSSSNSVQTDLFCELLIKPFSARNIIDKNLLVGEWPMPDLGYSSKSKGRGGGVQAMWYTKKKWLCASESWKKLFCWPCLLFCLGSSTTWRKNV